ncbi:MAG: hypothetical protein ABSH33_23265 [Steroidobacteraceae bacterium]|jgi:hypothetical protein
MAILSSANVTTIADAMLGVLNKGGTALAQYVQSEAAKFAQSIETIGQLYASGQIDQSEATAQLALQQSASQTVLTSVEGIGAILAGQAINAGLNAVAGIVNKAIGFALL